MKKIFKIIIAIVVLAAAGTGVYFLCSRESKETRTELNILNWTSYIPNEIIEEFEKKYNIKVNYSTYSSNEELLAKVSSSNPGTYDLIFPSDYMVELMIERKMLENIDKSRLKNYQNIDAKLLNQKFDEENQYSLPFLLATTVITYDDSKISDINSYQDLFSSDLKNSLILIDDQRVIIGSMLSALGYSFNDTDSAHLEESLSLFNKLEPNIKAFDSDSPKTFFITGEADAGIIWNAEAILAQSERENIAIVYPKEGFVISMDNFCIMKDAKNTESAYLFIDFILQNDIARRIIEEYPYISSNHNINTVSDSELAYILSAGSYIENIGKDIKKLDKLWSRYK